MRSKFGNRKTIMDGIRFDSQKEAAQYAKLRILQKNGQIGDLKVHPSYLIQEGFSYYEGSNLRPVYYEADFEFQEKGTGTRIIQDVKGFKPPVYKLKKK